MFRALSPIARRLISSKSCPTEKGNLKVMLDDIGIPGQLRATENKRDGRRTISQLSLGSFFS